VSVIVEICQLVAPLGDDAERVFDEGDDDEEAAYDGEVGFEWFRHGVEYVLDLAGLLPYGIERTRVCGSVGSIGASKVSLVAQVVARCSAYLCHGVLRFRACIWWQEGAGRRAGYELARRKRMTAVAQA